MNFQSVFLGLGSNIGNRSFNIQESLRLLKEIPTIKIIRQSTVIETAPVGNIKQGFFLNQVIEIVTDEPPNQLLQICLQIEEQLGRVRIQKWGPRIIDIDILFFGSEIMHIDGLCIPHPEAARRLFVLEPMAEIASEYIHPELLQPIRVILHELQRSLIS